MKLKHPYDWLAHAALCGIIAWFRWDYAIVVAITIEATQIESGIWQRWDHLIDLLFDGIGIILSMGIKAFVFMRLLGI